MDLDEAHLRARLAELGAESEKLAAERHRIRSILDGPRVDAVAHYYRHHSPYSQTFDTVQEAEDFLTGGEEQGYHASVGVSVGGAWAKLYTADRVTLDDVNYHGDVFVTVPDGA